MRWRARLRARSFALFPQLKIHFHHLQIEMSKELIRLPAFVSQSEGFGDVVVERKIRQIKAEFLASFIPCTNSPCVKTCLSKVIPTENGTDKVCFGFFLGHGIVSYGVNETRAKTC